MHIFPRQFKLPNVFTTSTAALKTEYGSSRLDYTDLTFIIDTERRKRKEGIKSGGRMKSPRLKELLEEIWRRYRKVDWWKLRAICCPSHVGLQSYSYGSAGREERGVCTDGLLCR